MGEQGKHIKLAGDEEATEARRREGEKLLMREREQEKRLWEARDEWQVKRVEESAKSRD